MIDLAVDTVSYFEVIVGAFGINTYPSHIFTLVLMISLALNLIYTTLRLVSLKG